MELVLLVLLVAVAGLAVASARRRARHAGGGECVDGHSSADHVRAMSLLRDHALDSLDPFVLREDKRFFFAGGGMIAFRLISRTAVVAGDPIASSDAAPRVVERFLSHAADRGWGVAMTGVSARHLEAYRDLEFRALRIGGEAVVDPRSFSLAGRRMRKVRQSVTRVARRGWSVDVLPTRAIDASTRAELDAVERCWGAARRRVGGFAMTFGGLRGPHEDLEGIYVLARDPEGRLRAFQRYIAYRHGLSLDLTRRLGDEPNGLCEAMVAAVLERARELELPEVSLNFAGFEHLMAPQGELRFSQRVARAALSCLHGRFQLDRLVRFNDKFLPTWRPRYLLYRHRALLPVAGLRTLQAEGYLRAPRRRALTTPWRPRTRPVGQSMGATGPQASR